MSETPGSETPGKATSGAAAYYVSARFTADKLAGGKIEDMIDVFEDQVLYWHVEPAKMIRDYQHAGFAVLAIILPYFESVGYLQTGSPAKPWRHFLSGMEAVFPEVIPLVPKIILREFFDQVRNGVAHSGITKSKVVVAPAGRSPFEVLVENGRIVRSIQVVPRLLIDEVENHLRRYVAQLRDQTNEVLRRNFETAFLARATN